MMLLAPGRFSTTSCWPSAAPSLGALPPKFGERIVCAAVAIGGYGPGLEQEVRRALELGATKEEMVEVFQSAYFHTGALTLVQGMIQLIGVLKEMEQEAATPAARRRPKRARGSARPRT